MKSVLTRAGTVAPRFAATARVPMQIRPARPEDAPQIAALVAAVWVDTYATGGVFTVTNVSTQSRTATLALLGPSQVASATFASSGTASATLAPGASTSVTLTTSPTVAGHGSGTLRLGLGGSSWLYRDYDLALDAAPSAPATLDAVAKPTGRVDLSWSASSTTANLAGYHVYRSTGASWTRLTAAPVSGTSYSDATKVDGTL